MREQSSGDSLGKVPDEVLRLAFGHAGDGVLVADGEGRVAGVNTAYQSLTGLSGEAVVGKRLQDLAKGGVVRHTSALLCLESGEAVTAEEHCAGGSTVTGTSSPVPGAGGKMAWVVTWLRDLDELRHRSQETRAANSRRAGGRRELAEIREELLEDGEMIARDERMLGLLQMAKRLAKVSATVLLLGETGVGKEELAKYIHSHSPRKERDFVKINCGALPENLIESELFGYEEGAFTGAQRDGKRGIFQEADGGTVFLDEIGELSHSIQVKLLRFLQEQEFTPIGGHIPVKVDVRIITATNRNLEEMVRDGLFRNDLYYRINVAPLTIPPLRERRDDIVPLARAFCDHFNHMHGQHKVLSRQAEGELREYNWPGNVRELRNMVERLVIIQIPDLIEQVSFAAAQSSAGQAGQEQIAVEVAGVVNMKDRLERMELEYIEAAYHQHRNVRDAAAHLSMEASTFVRKRQRYLKKYKPD